MVNKRLFSSGHLTEEGVGLYVDALKLQRTAELPDDVLNHVADCTQCKLKIADLQGLLTDVQYSHVHSHPFFDRSSPGRFVYRIAAALALTLGGSAVLYYYSSISIPRDREGHGQSIATRHDTSASSSTPIIIQSAPPPDTLYAAEFEPSANLEDLVGSNIRSSSAEVVSPSIGETVTTGGIHLAWNGGMEKPFRIVIVTNVEKVVRTVATKKRKYDIADSLTPGLYYWKIEQGGDLLGVGKFFVK